MCSKNMVRIDLRGHKRLIPKGGNSYTFALICGTCLPYGFVFQICLDWLT